MRISDWSSDVCSSDLRGISVNKNEMIAAVASEAVLSKADATKAVDAVFDVIAGALKSGDEVRLVGFGTFAVSERGGSTGRNPGSEERGGEQGGDSPC